MPLVTSRNPALRQAGNARFAFRKNKSALFQAGASVKSFVPWLPANSLEMILGASGFNREMFLQTSNPIPQGPKVFIVECQSPNLLIKLDGMPRPNFSPDAPNSASAIRAMPPAKLNP